MIRSMANSIGHPARARRPDVSRALLAIAVAGSIGLAACTGSVVATSTGSSPAASPQTSVSLPPAATGPYNPNTDPVVLAVRRVEPAVVNVTTRVISPASAFGGSGTGRAVGTGFIVRSSGVVATNYHVVEGAISIKVTLPGASGKSFAARVIGGDKQRDLAVLQLQGASNLPTVSLGNSSTLDLGQRVVALGYALALPGGPTVTSGIVSSLARTVQAADPNGGSNGQGITRTYQDALQTDAAINPGNSGGPLIDLNGNVIGINTAGNQQAQNIGFAIAIDAAKPIISQAIAHPSAPAAYLGVTTQSVTPGLAAQFSLPVDHGAIVLQVAPGGGADNGGIQVNDIIVAFGGKTVNSSDDLGVAIDSHKPGDTVSVRLVTPTGGNRTVSVTLGTRPLPRA